MSRDQISVSFSSAERELINQIADDLGQSASTVVRDAAIHGLPEIIERYEKIMKARKIKAAN